MLGNRDVLAESNPVLLVRAAQVTLLRQRESQVLLMTSKKPEKNQPPPKNLKRVFESAVHDIYQAGLTGRTSQYRTPIVQRAGNSAPLDAKNRALSDAAKALAQLWRISQNSGR